MKPLSERIIKEMVNDFSAEDLHTAEELIKGDKEHINFVLDEKYRKMSKYELASEIKKIRKKWGAGK